MRTRRLVSLIVLGSSVAAGAACSSAEGPSDGDGRLQGEGAPANPDESADGSSEPSAPASNGGGEGNIGAIPLTPPSTGSDSTPEDPPAPPALEGDIRFSVPSGTFEGPLSVTLEASVEGGQIRYTVDGSAPGAGSPLYTEALTFEETRQVRAQTFVDGMPVGRAGTALYIARTFDATSDLPLILVDGYGAGKPEDRDVYADMAFMVFEPGETDAALSNAPTLATRGGWHLRGQSSAAFEQAPYRIELWDNASEDVDHPLLGMPAEADWALIGPFVDRALIRNAFAYDLGRAMGLSAPRFAFAEAYINYEDRPLEPGDYQGIYMVVETIKNHPERLDLAQLAESDTGDGQLSGGYIFKFDWAASEEPTLTCSGSEPLGGGMGGGFGPPNPNAGGTCWTDLEVVDPEPLAPEQAAWLTAYVQQFHDALHEASFEEYSELIDVGSFVDVFIVNELTRNLDAYTRSAYYFKERDQPISAGPLWDFNLTLGAGFGTSLEVVGWQFEERRAASDWYRILGVDPAFLERVSGRWQELRQTLLSDEQLALRIDGLAAPLAAAAVRDFERWPVAEVSESIFQIPTTPTWEGQLQALRDWLSERVAWMDSQL